MCLNIGCVILNLAGGEVWVVWLIFFCCLLDVFGEECAHVVRGGSAICVKYCEILIKFFLQGHEYYNPAKKNYIFLRPCYEDLKPRVSS